MSARSIWDERMVCIITGASQNLGSVMAAKISEVLQPGSLVLLTSRSADRLQKVKEEITGKTGGRVHVGLLQWDLSRPDSLQYANDLKSSLSAINAAPEDFHAAVLLHNAAAMGDMGKSVAQMSDVKELTEVVNINLISMIAVNAVCLDVFRGIKRKCIVNMTAPSAHKALPSFGYMAIVKPGRQMAMNVLSKENPEIKVLHFDPGLVDTSALRQIRDTAHNPGIREWMLGSYQSDGILPAESVAGALIKALKEDTFETTAYINAFDALGIAR